MKRIFTAFLTLCLLSCGAFLTACGDAEPSDADTLSDAVESDDKTEEETDFGREDDKSARLEKEALLRETFLAGANAVRVEENTATFTDASGRGEITIEKNPASVANLYASFTTLWYEAGGTATGCIGGDSAVALYEEYIGRDITQDEGMTIAATSAAGKKWDVESVIAMNPSLIICSTAMSGYSTIEGPASSAGIPVIAVDYDDFSDYLKWFRVFCNLTGKPELWDEVALKTLDEVVEVLLSCPEEETPTVFSMFASGDSLQANTSRTVVGGMLSAMNAVNITDAWENATGAERLEINLETVFAADPDMIFVQCHADADAAKALVETTYGENPVWQALTAVREGRVYYLDKSLFHNKPNSRFAEAYATLAAYLYPED